MANVEKLLQGNSGVEFLTQLKIDPADEKLLNDSKKKIREHLRKVISDETKRLINTSIIPRFFTQGSGAYGLMNRPAWMPPQQIDLDDGVYLPMTFIKGALPSQAATLFFGIVDTALKALIRKEGWLGFVEKDTCARVLINGNLHIDVPLYAIPDVEFGRLAKASVARDMIANDSNDFDFMRSRKMKLDTWEELPSEKVLLAHRKEDWKASDPRKIHEWFLEAVDFFGERLRRQCRYMKAWRDHHRLDHVSSIALMAAVFMVFEDLGQLHIPRRDDLILLEIADRLPRILSSEIENPAEAGEKLTERWTQEERNAAVRVATAMKDSLNSCINQCYIAEVAVEHLQDVFGERIPNRPDLVSVHSAAATAVASAPALFVPAPAVGRSTTG